MNGKLAAFVAGLTTATIMTALAAVLFLGLDLRSLHRERVEATVPHELADAPAVAGKPERLEPCPPTGLVVPDLSPEELAKLRARDRRPSPAPRLAPSASETAPATSAAPAEGDEGESHFRVFRDDRESAPLAGGEASAPAESILLAWKKLPAAESRYGGEARAWLDPDGRTSLVFEAYPRPYFAWPHRVGAGALVSTTDPAERWRGYLVWQPLRVGNITARLEVGVDQRAGSAGTYVLAGAEYLLDLGSSR